MCFYLVYDRHQFPKICIEWVEDKWNQTFDIQLSWQLLLHLGKDKVYSCRLCSDFYRFTFMWNSYLYNMTLYYMMALHGVAFLISIMYICHIDMSCLPSEWYPMITSNNWRGFWVRYTVLNSFLYIWANFSCTCQE